MSFRRIAVLGRSSTMSAGNCSAYVEIATGSKMHFHDIRNGKASLKYLVERRHLQYCLNRSEYVYDCHFVDENHRLVIVTLKEKKRMPSKTVFGLELTILINLRYFSTFDNISTLIGTCFSLSKANENHEQTWELIKKAPRTCCWISFILFTFFNSAS